MTNIERPTNYGIDGRPMWDDGPPRDRGAGFASLDVANEMRALRHQLRGAVDALRALHEASRKVPLKPSDADDATLLAFIRALREAGELLAAVGGSR